MAINIIRSELVKPSEATPQSPVWLSNLDLGARNSYTPMINLFHTQSDDCLGFFSADALRTALTRALVLFYPLAGRLGMALDGRVEINCNAEGAVFIVTESDVVLDDMEGFTPSKAMCDMFVPPYEKEAGAGSPLLLLQGDEYTRSLVDYLETADVRSKPGRELPDTDLRVISWMGMASQDADFGWGEPVLIAPAVMSYTWFIYNIGNNGDVAVAVAMKPDHLERFKELFFDDNEM
ncbi:unnamed protein product [Alopecurus aequalis]